MCQYTARGKRGNLVSYPFGDTCEARDARRRAEGVMGLFVGAEVQLALENLSLAVDPLAKHLIPVEAFVGVS